MTQEVKYDSTADTLLHIKRVNELMVHFAQELLRRATIHDASKLAEPEKAGYDTTTFRLKGLTYGSDEYRASLRELKPTIEHHYAANSHHPEHYANGIDGFDLYDLVEMFWDWKAAGERHTDGSILRSIEINKERFKMSDQLCSILRNTAERMEVKVK